MKIFLIGWFGAGNAGDEAILVSELLFLRSRIREPEFHILSFDPEKTRKITAGMPEVKKILRMGSKSKAGKSDFSGINRAFNEADLVIIGGGGIFQDIYNRYPIPFFAAMAFLSRIKKKLLALYCVGIGPVRATWSGKLCRYAANAADFVSVRDEESESLLRAFGVTKEILVSADPVFLLEPAWNEKTLQAVKNIEGNADQRFVGVCVQELLPWDDSNKAVLAEVLDAVARESNARIVMLPMGAYRDGWTGRSGDKDTVDVAASKRLAARMESRVSILPMDLSPPELLGVIRKMDLVISMRLHGVIMGLAAAVPVIAMTYEEETKIRNLMYRVGREKYLFDVRRLDRNALVGAASDLLSESPGRRDILSEKLALMKSQAEKCNERMIETFLEKGLAC
ncbi:MAG: polysaccharide pyruvyl transferase family protein [Deltaproteobacteria bacterium]|nr:polysaccharide pyruvyl transferase family protein [Deltaproteobacteria bacterium]